MAVAGVVHRRGVEVEDLRDLARRPGPFLTVHLLTPGGIDNPGPRSEQRWRSVRQRLAAEGAPEPALAAVDPLVADAHLHGEVLLALIDDQGEQLLVEHLGEALPDDRAAWGPLPDLVPLLAWRQSRPPHLLVWADRGGADVVVVGADGSAATSEVGAGDPARKVAPGGESQRRYQQRADEDWAATATEVADAVTRAADRAHPRLVVLGGDVTATRLVLDRLPGPLAGRTRLIDPGRATDGSEAVRDEEVRRLLATAVAEDTVEVLGVAREELGQNDRGATGADATVDALNRGAIDLLLLADDPGSDRLAWISAAPVPVDLGDDPGSAVEAPIRAPLGAALLRGALATGASVRIVPYAGPLDDGVGALLRWPAPPDPEG